MHLVDISELTNQLLTVSAITKVLVDVLSAKLGKSKYSTKIKIALAYIIPIIVAVASDVSIVETSNQAAEIVGCVAAGAIAGLGSTFIHDILNSLQAVKGLKK